MFTRNQTIAAAVVLLIIIVLAGVWLAHQPNQAGPKSSGTIQVAPYSMSGSVSKISGSDIYLKVTETKTDNGMRALVEKDKVVRFVFDTEVAFLNKTTFQKSPARLADILVGSQITVYTKDKAPDVDTVLAARIDILK